MTTRDQRGLPEAWRKHGWMSAVIGAFAWTGAWVCSAEEADVVVRSGRIVVDEGRLAQAMAVSEGKIQFVGTDREARAWVGEATEVINLQGRMVLPGLMDSHTHPLSAAMIEFDHEIPEMRTIADVLAYVRHRAGVVKEGEWIVIQQVFITRLEERRYPSRAELDEAAPDHPVIFRTGPDASLNSRALEHFKIDAESESPEGSRIERDARGRPSGILRGWNQLIDLPQGGGASPQEADRLQRLKALFADYNAVGITGIIDRNASDSGLALYSRLEGNEELNVRMSLSRAVSHQGEIAGIRERVAAIANEPACTMGSDRLRTVGIKMFLDGGMLTGSAFMRKPWGTSEVYGIRDPEYRGLRFIPEDKLEAAIGACAEHGLQFTAHSVGDGAVHALLDAYAKVTAQPAMTLTRPNITHCNFMSAEAIRRMAAMGVSADIQPAWLYLDTRTLAPHFGEDRLTYFQPLKDLFEAGVIAGGGSDHMQKIGPLRSINPYHPFLGMWIALTRRARGYEGALHPEQALDRWQALRFYTRNNAYLMFMEDRVGALEPGKWADFIIIDRDYFSCPVDEIRKIRVMETWLEGRRVYSRED